MPSQAIPAAIARAGEYPIARANAAYRSRFSDWVTLLRIAGM
jgi:hypothetical protein